MEAPSGVLWFTMEAHLETLRLTLKPLRITLSYTVEAHPWAAEVPDKSAQAHPDALEAHTETMEANPPWSFILNSPCPLSSDSFSRVQDIPPNGAAENESIWNRLLKYYNHDYRNNSYYCYYEIFHNNCLMAIMAWAKFCCNNCKNHIQLDAIRVFCEKL
jgi:hypothetical protein